MQKVVLIFFFVKILSAQAPFFNEPRISGTPLTPSKEYVIKYFEELQNSDYTLFQKLTRLQKTTADIGDERTFNVLNLEDPKKPKFDNKLFVLKKTNTLINVWVEKDELDNDHVTNSVIDDIYNGLIDNTPIGSLDPSQGIYEIDINVFGLPPNFDGDGITDFLLTDIQDGWIGEGAFIGGFFYPGDQTPNLGSNRADILYIDTFPGIYRESNGSATYNTENVLGTVSHEFQHLIQFANNKDEETWLNEGLSEIASFLCGYGLRSPELYLKNTDLQLSSWDNDNSLPHYSRVALWTYYLYETYGLPLISEISKNTQTGINGINDALHILGISKDVGDISEVFFKTLAANDPNLTPGFSFDWAPLQYIKSIPQQRVVDYFFDKNISLAPFSFQSIEFTNGDSLAISISGISVNNLVVNKLGFENDSYLNEIFSLDITDNEFGSAYHTFVLHLINNSSQNKNVSIDARAIKKYDLKTVMYGGDSPTFLITSTGNTNAIQFIAENDTTLLKSIEFYNSGGNSDIKLHLYNTSISNNSNPSSESTIIKNVVNSGWTRIDVEDFQYFRNSNNFFDVGIEYLAEGAIGYESVNGTAHMGRSYLKTSPGAPFKRLDNFTVGSTTLNGIWMIRLELATPGTGNGNTKNGTISVNLSTNLFLANGSNLLEIRYDADSGSDISINIYNSLGQIVYTANSSAAAVTWDGKNRSGTAVAAGMYFVSVSSKTNTVYTRFALFR